MTAQPEPAPAPGNRGEPTGTAALLVNRQGQYLLHLRDANKPIWQSGSWALPGGGREPGETLDDCVVRELDEEARLRVPDLRPFAIIDAPDADGPILVYLGTWDGDPSSLNVTEGIMLRWTSVEQIRWLTMDPGTAAVIARHQADPRPPARDRVETIRIPRAGSSSVLNGVGAHLYLEHGGDVLLGKRHPSCAYAPGMWHALAGHCEMESVRTAVAREACEESGLIIAPRDLRLVHTVHVLDPGSTRPLLELFFAPTRWRGQPTVREPHRCTEWRMWPVGALPDDLVDYTRIAIRGITGGQAYSEMGWS